jgi:hypothetical protein
MICPVLDAIFFVKWDDFDWFNLMLCSLLCRYGDKRVGSIPQNSWLIFDVELVGVEGR